VTKTWSVIPKSSREKNGSLETAAEESGRGGGAFSLAAIELYEYH